MSRRPLWEVVRVSRDKRDATQERRNLTAAVLRGLRACVGYRPTRFYGDHILELVYCLEQLKRRRWTTKAIKQYWDWERDGPKLERQRDAMIALLVERRKRCVGRNRKAALRRGRLALAIAELKAIESGVFWPPGFFGEGKPKKPYAFVTRMLGGLVLRALRGADRLNGRGIGLDGAVRPAGPLRARLSGGPSSPVVTLICEWLDWIYETEPDPDKPEKVLKVLQTIRAAEGPEDFGDRERP
jgi:hypothetical protein